ncbi:metallophosphoesterase family protein [Ferrimicrobium acidiphilum]|uniref:Metallophosphoesterase n=1 Tax=Ferrimicrobium acidiphilum TaxID=121039 RepID=A0ABV3XYU7_9ACTN
MEAVRFVRSEELERGQKGGFFGLQATSEQQHKAPGRRLAKIVHLSDIQLADVKSPARYEWANAFSGVEGFGELIPSYRAQEFMVAHALVAMIRHLNDLVAGEERVCAVVTGDSIDNSQRNELDNFVAAIAGGIVNLQSGDSSMALVSAHGFGDVSFWHPDPGDDDYKRCWGCPTVEGMLEAAFGPIVSPGLACDWFVTNGNHELLIQGIGITDEETASIAVGGEKQVGPPTVLPTDPERSGVEMPVVLLTGGPSQSVAPDLGRQFVNRRVLARAIRQANGTPQGHGLNDDDLLYYASELSDEMVLVGLDTAYRWGGAQGAIDVAQARWLVEVLRRYSTQYWGDDGSVVTCDGDDRLIVVAAHHPLATMTNSRAGVQPGFLLGDWLCTTLLQFPNVVLFLNGHTHENRVQVHRDGTRQLLEVTTSALMDWPCEARSLEITVDEDDLWITSVMLNFDGAGTPGPEQLDTVGLASWHRLLAANTPGLGRAPEGNATDRNFSWRQRRPRWLRA